MAKYRSRQDLPDSIADRYVGSSFLFWPSDRKGPWLLRVQWTRVDDRLECCGLEIRSFRESDEAWPTELPRWDEQPEILTRAVLRDVPLGAILHDLRQEGWEATMRFADSISEPGDAESLELAEDFRRMARRHRGQRPRGIAPLDQVAAVYQDAQRRRAHPTEAVKDHWKVAHSTAAKWVMRAREEGHLPPSGRAKRGQP